MIKQKTVKFGWRKSIFGKYAKINGDSKVKHMERKISTVVGI